MHFSIQATLAISLALIGQSSAVAIKSSNLQTACSSFAITKDSIFSAKCALPAPHGKKAPKPKTVQLDLNPLFFNDNGLIVPVTKYVPIACIPRCLVRQV